MSKRFVLLLLICVMTANLIMLPASFALASDIGGSVDFEYEDFSSYSSGELTALNDFAVYHNNPMISSDGDNNILKFFKEYIVGSDNSVLIQTADYSAETELIFSFDIKMNNTGCEFGLVLDGGCIPFAFKNGEIAYFEDYDNRGNVADYAFGKGGWSRVAVKINPASKEFLVYIDGQCVRTSVKSDFDFSSFWIRLYGNALGTDKSLDVSLDNIYLYENISINDLYGLSSPFLFKNGEAVTMLYSGSTEARIFAERLVQSDGDSDGKKLIFAMYNKDELTDIPLCTELDFSELIQLVEFNVKAQYDTSGDYGNFYLWDDELIPLCKALKFDKDTLLLPSENEIEALLADSEVSHPFIGANEADFKRIKELIASSDAYMTELYSELIAKCDRICEYSLDNDIDYATAEKEYWIRYEIQNKRLLYMSSRVLDFVQTLAMAYNICDDEEAKDKYAQRAIEIILRVCGEGEYGFQDWHPEHFLDTGTMCLAVSLGYDWLYGALDNGQKTKILTALKTMGIDEGISAYKNKEKWTGYNNNWNPTCNEGLLCAALVYGETDLDYVSELISKTLTRIPMSVKGFNPDGAWSEGLGYAVGTAENVVRILKTINNAFGTELGIDMIDGFRKSGEFFLYAEGPAGVNNYGNSKLFKVNSPSMHYYADIYNSKYLRDRQIERTDGSSVQSMLLYNPDLSGGGIPYERDMYFKGAELISMRSSWDEDALWLSACGGDTFTSHGHHDAGAFVIDYKGIRFASDLGSDTKNTTYYATDVYNKEAYRVRAEGHNTLVINPDAEPGQVAGVALVEKCQFNADNPFAIIDMGAVYDKADVTEAKRGFMLSDSRQTVTIRDEIALASDGDSEVYWFLHSTAELEIKDGKVYMTSDDGIEMVLEYSAQGDGIVSSELSLEKAEPLIPWDEDDKKWQSTNDEYKKICIKLTGKGSMSITAKLTPADLASYTLISELRPLSQW